MCPLYPLHLVFTYGFLILLLWVMGGESLLSSLQKGQEFSLRFLTEKTPQSNGSSNSVSSITSSGIDLNEDEMKQVTFYIEDLPPDAIGEILLKETSEDGITHLEIKPDTFPVKYDEATGQFGPNNVTLSGKFLGFSKLRFVLSPETDDKEMLQKELLQKEVNVKVHRETKTLDIIFIHVVVILVLLAYINMGCAINLDVIRETMRRPVAPAIGLASQYLFMPLVSYGIGYALFPSSPELWLGLFLTGCAPGGGGSNMWTYILGGSLDLSITMTFLSTVFAFAALPLWVLALGPSIFAEGYFGRLPYRNIAILVFSLVVPCAIGVGIRRCSPKAADFLKKMLKPLSIFFIIFIMTFGVYAKFYLFSFFTWRVAVAGFCLPFFGFVFGATMSILLKRKWEDMVAISIETGVQNTGLAIGVLKIALGSFSPLDDIAIVLPVAVATMTPLPLAVCLIAKYIRNKLQQKPKVLDDACDESRIAITNINYIKDSNGNTKNFLP